LAASSGVRLAGRLAEGLAALLFAVHAMWRLRPPSPWGNEPQRVE
jgi:hypothetical protein